MRIVLISPYSQVEATGLRLLSACLKRAGFATRILFLPDIQEMVVGADFGARRLTPSALDELLDLCADADLIGLSVMTPSVFLARWGRAAYRQLIPLWRRAQAWRLGDDRPTAHAT